MSENLSDSDQCTELVIAHKQTYTRTTMFFGGKGKGEKSQSCVLPKSEEPDRTIITCTV